MKVNWGGSGKTHQGRKRKRTQEFHPLSPGKTPPKHLFCFPSVPEDGDSYVQPEDENYEHESVRQLETELQMEEYLKQKLQDEAFQVLEAAASLPLHSPPHWVLPTPWKCRPPSLFLRYFSRTFWWYSSVRVSHIVMLNVSCSCLFFQILMWTVKRAFVMLAD